MTRLTVDASLPEKLANLQQPAELCDASGRVLGHYIPGPVPAEYGPFEPQISEEELRRRQNSTERMYTTAEVLAHPEKL